MKIMSVVGARPNFMKAAPVIAALRERKFCEQRLVHTDQHYDDKLSRVFFDELGLPKPDVHLGVGSKSHTQQTAEIMLRFEKVLQEEAPSLVVVYGDVNSTVACALVCAKMGVPVAHVEAGLRSFDRTMPEEINRLVTDAISTYLFTTEPSADRNLAHEGVPPERVFFVGNVMVDTLMRFRTKAMASNILNDLGLHPQGYAVLTLHRPSNVDDNETLRGVLDTLSAIAKKLPVVFPCHPRTQARIASSQLVCDGVRLLDPLGYLDFLCLTSQARIVITDSGGIQEETTVLGIPCLTLRDNTERPVTIEQGTNVLVGNNRERILTAAAKVLNGGSHEGRVPELWDGRAAVRIAEVLVKKLGRG